jgi:hypothetical protein
MIEEEFLNAFWNNENTGSNQYTVARRPVFEG